ncbi:MAG: sigma-70 family RNA polymerase sigma factor [Acidimicrobiia bacterium]|nr:sigma-70 family RNA polymerase sigma factor [Acidimicrobiia bacterium]MDX2466413.1 sigma-70 family RNA polymerase sigma factor [Acidimicrobiia bacterium]
MAGKDSTPREQDQADQFFDELHAATFRQVVAYCRRRAATVEDADDAVAEVYVVAWRRLREVRRADVPIAWLYGVARRVLANQHRARSRRLRLIERLTFEWRQKRSVNPADLVASHEGTDTILLALAQLSPIDQDLIRLASLEGLTNAEIGIVLDLRPDRVRDRHYSARKRLEAQLLLLQTSDNPDEVDTSGAETKQGDETGESGGACAQP